MKRIILLLIFLIPAPLFAQSAAPQQGKGQFIRERIEKFRAALDSLDLSPDQREKVNSLLRDTAEKFKDLQNEDPATRPEIVRSSLQELREQLGEVLTAPQLQQLRQKMQQTPVNTPATQPTTQPATVITREETKPEKLEKPAPAVDSPAPAKTGVSAEVPIQPEKPAPDFKLLRLDNSPVTLSSMKGRVVVLIFASYTCPTFRERAASLNRLYHDEQDKASIFLIYTREAHPADGWDVQRNKDDHINIQQPTSDAARRSVARLAHTSLHLLMPILMDTMDDAVTESYSGFPNAAVIIDRDGNVADSIQWADAVSLRHMIDKIPASPAP